MTSPSEASYQCLHSGLGACSAGHELRYWRVSGLGLMMTSLLAAALEYAGRGWAVFPVEPRSKKPLGKLVPHGLKDAATDPNLIVKWWKAAPEANIGLPTGIHFDVLDVDEPGSGALARMVDANTPMAIGATAVTPGGGAHYLFLPTGEGNRAGFVPGCDWRGRGGYIVAAPSVHPNGGQYEWAIGPDEEPLIEAPSWLVAALQKPSAAPAVDPSPAKVRGGTAYAKAALRGECEAVASTIPGERNHRLNIAAFKAGTLIASGLLDPDEAAAALLSAAASAGLGEQEARATIASGMRAGLHQPRQVAS